MHRNPDIVSIKQERIAKLAKHKFVQHRVSDGVLLRLIGKWLNAGVMESGQISYPEAGSPQGGVISPLLANVYLHYVLDTWFEQEVQPRLAGRAYLIRYADDFVIGFTEEKDAHRVKDVLPKRFGKYGLKIHPEKTRLVRFNKPNDRDGSSGHTEKSGQPESFDLLGFTHYWGRSRRGTWVVKRKTSDSRLSRGLRAINEWCRNHLHDPLTEQQQALSRKIRGHCAYYAPHRQQSMSVGVPFLAGENLASLVIPSQSRAWDDVGSL